MVALYQSIVRASLKIMVGFFLGGGGSNIITVIANITYQRIIYTVLCSAYFLEKKRINNADEIGTI